VAGFACKFTSENEKFPLIEKVFFFYLDRKVYYSPSFV
jgi:hypothetical protein